MKFINYLKNITDVEIYPLISLFIFFVFFLALLIYVFAANKNHMRELKNMPLENEN